MYVRLPQRSAVSSFLHERERYCEFSLDIVVPVKVGGGKESECFANALNASRDFSLQLCSGWLALPLSLGGFQFIAHWWNFDVIKGHFVDYSPAVDEFAVYILDMDLAGFAVNYNHNLTSCVCSSVVLRGNGWQKVTGFGVRMALKPLDDLSTSTLFSDFLGAVRS